MDDGRRVRPDQIRMLRGRPAALNAYLESMLLHARALIDFFVRTRGYPTDIRRTDFAQEWQPAPEEAVRRIKASYKLVDKYLAHLTWDRVDSVAPAWGYDAMVADLIAVADQWSIHLHADSRELHGAFRHYVVWARHALTDLPQPPSDA